MEYSEENPIPSPMQTLWEENYPFDYWQNRILKISPYNPQDKLEAVFVLLQLADTYSTVLAAKLRNPYEPWYVIVDELPTRQIHQTLELLQVEAEHGDYIDLNMLEEGDIEGLIGYDIKDEWKDSVSPFEILAIELLGCPAQIDTDSKSIDFAETPEQYVAACNGIVNFWKDHTMLLNDLKHGFRLLPFDIGTFDNLLEMGLLQSSEIDLDEKMDEYEKTKDDYLYFWRLEIGELADPVEFEKDGEVDIGMRLVVYRTDAMMCRELADITLRLLHNLFGRGGEHQVVDSMNSLADGEDSISMVDDFLRGELVYAQGQPEN